MWGEVSTALETKHAQAFQTEALAEVQSEYPKYFDALQKHPRLLIGETVPAIGKEGTETIRDSADAAEWQDAVKTLLIEEVKDRAVRKADDGGAELVTVHATIELFQNNVDLIPGTKQFDRELADQFTRLAEPYKQVSAGGKFIGYSIPTQPLVNQIRTQLAAARAAAPAPAPAAAPAAPAATVQRQQTEQPQAGIPSKAGSGGEGENFDALFGTIGLSGLRF